MRFWSLLGSQCIMGFYMVGCNQLTLLGSHSRWSFTERRRKWRLIPPQCERSAALPYGFHCRFPSRAEIVMFNLERGCTELKGVTHDQDTKRKWIIFTVGEVDDMSQTDRRTRSKKETSSWQCCKMRRRLDEKRQAIFELLLCVGHSSLPVLSNINTPVFRLGCSPPHLPFLPANLILTSLMMKSWTGTMHRLSLTLQTLGFFLQSGLAPGHPPNHMVTKTTRLCRDTNVPRTMTELFAWIRVGGFNYYERRSTKESAPYRQQQKSCCFSGPEQIYVCINSILHDYVESAAASWHYSQLTDC